MGPKLDLKNAPPTSRVGTSGPGRVGDEKGGQNRKPDAVLKSQRKIKKSTFFFDFFGPDFFGLEILAESKVPPPLVG